MLSDEENILENAVFFTNECNVNCDNNIINKFHTENTNNNNNNNNCNSNNNSNISNNNNSNNKKSTNNNKAGPTDAFECLLDTLEEKENTILFKMKGLTV